MNATGEIKSMKLTTNFTLNELVYSVTAEANKIDNRPNVKVVANLKALCENVLQPLRDYLGCPVIVSSGFRCAELNKKVGGRPNSQHLLGEAADFVVPQRNLKDAFNYIKGHLKYDQLLFEYDLSGNRWIHVSYRADGKNRRQAIDNYMA